MREDSVMLFWVLGEVRVHTRGGDSVLVKEQAKQHNTNTRERSDIDTGPSNNSTRIHTTLEFAF